MIKSAKTRKIILVVIFLILFGLCVLIFTGKPIVSFDKYLDDSPNFDVITADTSWYRNKVDTTLFRNYKVYGWLPEYSISTNNDYPEWISNMYLMYPEDVMPYAQLYDLVRDNCHTFEISEVSSYYSFENCQIYVIDVDGVPTVFTVDGSTVYEYLVSDEIK